MSGNTHPNRGAGSSGLNVADLERFERTLISQHVEPAAAKVKVFESRLSTAEDSEHRLRHHVKKLLQLTNTQTEELKDLKLSKESQTRERVQVVNEVGMLQTQVQELDRNLAVLIREHQALEGQINQTNPNNPNNLNNLNASSVGESSNNPNNVHNPKERHAMKELINECLAEQV